MEIWKDITGFERRYQVSNLGNVRSLDHYVPLRLRNGKPYRRLVRGRLLRPGPSKSGHLTVAVGKGNSRLVHQLVLEAFVGPRPARHEVLHINHQPADNRLSNLKYGTRSENLRMDYATGSRRRAGRQQEGAPA